MEHSFACPHCGEEISMVLDLSVREQTYVEDCEVCCKPIEISYTVTDEELAEFSARTLGRLQVKMPTDRHQEKRERKA